METVYFSMPGPLLDTICGTVSPLAFGMSLLIYSGTTLRGPYRWAFTKLNPQCRVGNVGCRATGRVTIYVSVSVSKHTHTAVAFEISELRVVSDLLHWKVDRSPKFCLALKAVATVVTLDTNRHLFRSYLSVPAILFAASMLTAQYSIRYVETTSKRAPASSPSHGPKLRRTKLSPAIVLIAHTAAIQ